MNGGSAPKRSHLAAVILCFAVAFLANSQEVIVNANSSPNLEPILNETLNIKRVSISHFPIHSKCPASIYEGLSLSRLQASWRGVKLIDDSTRCETGLCDFKRLWIWRGKCLPRNSHGYAAYSDQIVGRGLTRIFDCKLSSGSFPIVNTCNLRMLDRNISTQLPLGSIFRALHQSTSRPPQESSNHKQQEGKEYQETISKFNPMAEEYRELGSLIAAIICIFGGFISIDAGYRLQRNGWRWGERLGIVFGIIIGGWGIFGLFIGFDPWSLRRFL